MRGIIDMSKNLLRAGAATFYIVDDNLSHKVDDPFILWLKEKGYKSQMLGHPNAEHSLYVNVESKVYNWGMGGVRLSPILFNHAIHIEEFKAIYAIFEQYEMFPTGYYSMEQYRSVFGNDDSHLNMCEESIK